MRPCDRGASGLASDCYLIKEAVRGFSDSYPGELLLQAVQRLRARLYSNVRGKLTPMLLNCMSLWHIESSSREYG